MLSFSVWKIASFWTPSWTLRFYSATEKWHCYMLDELPNTREWIVLMSFWQTEGCPFHPVSGTVVYVWPRMDGLDMIRIWKTTERPFTMTTILTQDQNHCLICSVRLFNCSFLLRTQTRFLLCNLKTRSQYHTSKWLYASWSLADVSLPFFFLSFIRYRN